MTTFFVESYNYYNWIFGKVHVGVFIGLRVSSGNLFTDDNY